MALIMTVLHALSIAVGIVLLSRIFYRESSAPPPDRPKRFFGASARRAVQAALYGRPAMDCAHHLRGGGSDTESALAARVVSIADAIQRQLGEIVNKPGMKAIEAVLLMSMGAKSQKDVIAQVGTSKPSFLKYKPLVEQVLASCAVGATLAGAAALVGPSAAGVVGGCLAAAVLPLRITSLSNVSGVRLGQELVSDGRPYRIWLATVRALDGTKHEHQTAPVLHEPPLPGETADEIRRRENREHKRIVSALRAIDPEALAANRAKDRDRKRVKAVQRASQLLALPIADDDPAWLLPAAEQPHFLGEHVWHLAAGASPQLAVIQVLFRDGSASIAMCDGTVARTRAKDLIRVGLPVPSYVGQRVDISGDGLRDEYEYRPETHLTVPQPQLAAVTAVHSDGGVDVQLFDSSLGCYSDTRVRLHVEGETASNHDSGGFAVLQDVAMMLADEALVRAGHPTLEELVEQYGIEEGSGIEGYSQRGPMRRNRWATAPIRWLRFECSDGEIRLNGSIQDGSDEESDARTDASSDSGERSEESRLRETWRRPQLADPLSPQLTCAPGMPTCGQGCLCTRLTESHFNAFDHPPGPDGPHPYVVVAEAEAAGADMSKARELLAMLECSPLLLWPLTGGGPYDRPCPATLEEWKAYVYAATHWVQRNQLHTGSPTSEWTALREVTQSSSNKISVRQAFDEIDQILQRASAENSDALRSKQPKPQESLKVNHVEPRFLRIAQRAVRRKELRLRQTCIDWPTVRHPVASRSSKAKVL